MKLTKIWMVTAVLLIIVLSIITNANILQIIAAVCGVIYVFNNVLEKRSGQIFGVVNSMLYGLIMFKNGVYGTAIYDVIYCMPMQIYTFFTWGKNKEGKDRITISKYTTTKRCVITIVLALVCVVYYLIAGKLNVQFALVDGISIILGAAGLYMTSKKKIEQWYCFILTNIAMIAMWGIKCIENVSNVPMLVMWTIYIINNIYGLYAWSKKTKNKRNK